MRKVGDHDDGEDLEVGTAVGTPPLLPDGNFYIVGFLRAERGTFCGAGRIFLWFRIIEPTKDAGQDLYLCCPVPDSGKFGLGSKFVDAWRIASGKWPTRRDRLSTKVFRGLYFRASIQTVKRSQYGEERPATQHYSKIDRLNERLTE